MKLSLIAENDLVQEKVRRGKAARVKKQELARQTDKPGQTAKQKAKTGQFAGSIKKGEESNIAKAIRRKGKSQEEVADIVGVHKSTISRLKQYKNKSKGRKPSYDLLKKLTRLLGQPTSLFPDLAP